MSKLQDLLPQAAVIRDATDDKENTALRVGTMFVDFIQALIDVLPLLSIDGNLTESMPDASSFTIVFHSIDGNGEAHSETITVPVVTSSLAGLMSPALKAELHSATASITTLFNRTKEVFCTQADYDAIVDAGTIDSDTKYFIYED